MPSEEAERTNATQGDAKQQSRKHTVLSTLPLVEQAVVLELHVPVAPARFVHFRKVVAAVDLTIQMHHASEVNELNEEERKWGMAANRGKREEEGNGNNQEPGPSRHKCGRQHGESPNITRQPPGQKAEDTRSGHPFHKP